MKHTDLQKKLLNYTQSLGLQRIEIPELGTEQDPFVLFSRPRTPADMDLLTKIRDSQKFNVRVICLLGTNADGSPALEESDILGLYEGGSQDLLKQIADRMFFHTKPSVEDLKN